MPDKSEAHLPFLTKKGPRVFCSGVCSSLQNEELAHTVKIYKGLERKMQIDQNKKVLEISTLQHLRYKENGNANAIRNDLPTELFRKQSMLHVQFVGRERRYYMSKLQDAVLSLQQYKSS